ncbi:hypothetical protein C7M71_005295 [Peterkaempfera bronchialis]|uniref:Uncharacterized protein n=1 Tax=Peterkaempfera bronchialis TaxID=2126346 RepID=A0A345ST99_9ACTN|nr:hypothetical protein C7M71_005295 [Peterkaempfera bronchialis]
MERALLGSRPLGLAGALASLGREGGLGSRIGPADVVTVEETSRQLREWGNVHGSSGAIFQTAALGVLRQSVERAGDCPPRLRPQLLAATGRLALTLGSNRFDQFDHDAAKTLFGVATTCAEEADDWVLRASVMNWRARAYALLGQQRLALAAVDASDALFSSPWGDDEPAWLAYYDEPQHHGDTGHALRDLAIAGLLPPDQAAERLRTAVAGHPDAFRRSRAMSVSRLATLLLVTGDPQGAMIVAHQALDDVGQVHSRRAASDLGEFARIATRLRAPGTAAIRDRIAAAAGR